jgi:hypothetical protein
MLSVAITSAWPAWPHDIQEKVAWLGLFLSSIVPHSGHLLMVYLRVDEEHRDAGTSGLAPDECPQLARTTSYPAERVEDGWPWQDVHLLEGGA